MLDIQRLKTDYNRFKKLALEFYESGDYDNALNSIVGCATIGYEYNFIEKFCDDDLDLLIAKISSSQLVVRDFDSFKSKIVFYDYFALDNRGLTEQYLRGLIELNYEILYIVSNDLYFGHSENIIKLIKSSPNCSFAIFSNKLSCISRAQKICDRIYEFKPSKSILHFSPWDIVGFLVFTKLSGYLNRFFINLTDHAFWLGKNTFDYCIEFRNYGLSLTYLKRDIDLKKLSVLPYYPIHQDEGKSVNLEFDDELKGKIVGITGGAEYKYFDKDFTFYKLIKAMMNANKSFVLLMVGTGLAGLTLKQKSGKEGFGDRIFLLDFSPDLFSLMKKCDLYLSSCPIGGGLITQLAAQANLPILAFSKAENRFTYLEELLPGCNHLFHTITNFEEYINLGISLVTDISRRNEYKKLTENSIISPKEFKDKLESILNLNKNAFVKTQPNYNFKNLSELMSNLYIEIENEFAHKYDELISLLVSQLPEKNKNQFMQPREIKQPTNKFTKELLSFPIRIKQNFKRKIKGVISKIVRKVLRISKIEFGIPSKEETNYNFKKAGLNFQITTPSIIKNPKYISIGNNFNALHNLRIEAWDEFAGERFYPEIIIGNNVIMNSDVHIGCIDKVFVGNNVLFASRIYISDHSHGEITKEALSLAPSLRPLRSKGPVIIKDNVWIGEGVIVLPGVTIGENSIIGANSVVTKSFPPNCVAAGNPAKILKVLA